MSVQCNVMSTLESRGDDAGIKFLNNIVSGSIEALTLLARIGFRVRIVGTRTRERYHNPRSELTT